jgi:hypothetical protein
VWQMIVVVPVVLAATLYVAWTLLPGVLRLRLAARFAERTRRPGQPAWLAHLANRVERRARARAGPCGDCSGDTPPSSRPDRARH